MTKPIKVFYSPLSGKFYATNHYNEKDGHTEITGEKFDVTSDIGSAIDKFDIEFKKIPKKRG